MMLYPKERLYLRLILTEWTMEARQDNLAYEQWRENLHRHSYKMDSRSLQTGMFLHQFTNSVSKALHKDTSRAKRLTAEELYAKANPAIFTARKLTTENSKGSTVQLLLPTISKLGATSNIHELITQSNRTLKVERTAKNPKSTTPRESDDSFRLPKIMEITDREGNNWKIQQQGDKNTKEQQNKVSDVTNRVPAHIPPIEPVLVHSISNRNTTTTDPIEAVRQSNNIHTSHPKLPHINKNKHLMGTERKQRPHPDETSTCADDDFDDGWNDVRMSNSSDRSNPVSTYTKSFQNKMSYSNYLKHMSLPNVHQGEDGKTQRKRAEDAGKLQIQGTGQAQSDEPIKSHDIYCIQNHEELAEKINQNELTPRHARTHKVEVGKHIPKNFTEKQKNELRSLYPMYDWKVQNKNRSLETYNGCHGHNTPRKTQSMESLSTISSSSTSTVCSSVQCKMFRIPSSLGQDSLISKKSTRKNRKSPRDEMSDGSPAHLKTVNFVDVYENSEDGDSLDLRASIEHAQYRESKSMVFTRQPPPTPVEKHDATSVKSDANEKERLSAGTVKSTIVIETAGESAGEHLKENTASQHESDKISVSKGTKFEKKTEASTEVDFQTETENEKRTEHYSTKEDKLSVLVEVSSERYTNSHAGYPPAPSKQPDTVSENSATSNATLTAPSDDQTEKSRYVSLQPAIKTIEIPVAPYSKYSTTLDGLSDRTSPTAENNWKNKTEEKRKGVMSQQSSINANISTKDVVFVSPAAYVTKAS